jgi:hypothetical protein
MRHSPRLTAIWLFAALLVCVAWADHPADDRTVGPPATESTARPMPVAKWTGSADARTQPIEVTSGELRLMTLAIPNSSAPARLTVRVRDAGGASLQTISMGPLTTKQIKVTTVRTAPGARVAFEVEGTGVLWGLWAEMR